MNANTPEQKEVVRLRRTLHPLTMTQLNWIMGQDYEKGAEEYAKRKKKVSRYDYYAIVTSHKGWQISRYFMIHSSTSRNGYTFDFISEVSQRWMKVNAKRNITLCIFERTKRAFWQYTDQPYSLSKPLTLKYWDASYNRGGRDVFYIADSEIYPVRRFSKSFKEYGFDKYAGRVDEIDLYSNYGNVRSKIKTLPLERSGVKALKKACYLPTKAETLFKIGEPMLALETISRSHHAYLLDKYWNSFLIARRHGLKNIDWHLWLDYVADLEALGRDIRSPKYLIPADLGRAHGKIIDKLTEIREKMRWEQTLKNINDYEPKYAKAKGQYFGIGIVTEGGITISTAKSVMDIYKEGKAMHHCVYSCEYYKHENSLILFARDQDGKRVETIEVNLTNMTIAQSRGVCNKLTDRHDEIVKAVNENMWQIRDIRERVRMAS